jgi:hypothetical protein
VRRLKDLGRMLLFMLAVAGVISLGVSWEFYEIRRVSRSRPRPRLQHSHRPLK